MRLTYYQSPEMEEAENVSIAEAKKLLKKNGGRAWTEHYERDGCLFDKTEIELKGNNSKFKYNHHL
jgi:hypothetical protein